MTLLPRADLHTGTHAALLEDPPPGVRYVVRWGVHVFERFAAPPRSRYCPWRELSALEAIDASGSSGIVHSARWPVLGRRGWIADMDDWGYPCLLGRAAWNPEVRLGFRGKADRALQRLVRGRAARMVRAYAHESCIGIFMWTERAIIETAEWLVALDLEREGEAVLRKMHVLHPSQPALPRTLVARKWKQRPLRVVFVGRDYEAKNGDVALDVFSAMAGKFPEARFCFVGLVPERRRLAELGRMRNVEYHETLSRPRVLDILRDAHVLFHPARHESFGMVFAEAAAAGMAVVASCDGGMAHVREFLDEGNAYLVKRTGLTPTVERARFASVLRHALERPEEASRKAKRLHARAESGVLSSTHRDDVLRDAYERAAAARGVPLALDALRGEPFGVLARLPGERLAGSFERFRRMVGESRVAIRF